MGAEVLLRAAEHQGEKLYKVSLDTEVNKQADDLNQGDKQRILDAKTTHGLRRSLSWPDLTITPTLREGPSIPIRSPDGGVIGYLGWKTPQLANEALSLRRVVIGVAFLMTSLTTLGLHWKMRQAVRQMVGAEQAALRLAESDALTGIGNRRHFVAAGEGGGAGRRAAGPRAPPG